MTTTVGRFISFEGTEGVGKTTAIEGLCQRLQAAGIDYVRTREPVSYTHLTLPTTPYV